MPARQASPRARTRGAGPKRFGFSRSVPLPLHVARPSGVFTRLAVSACSFCVLLYASRALSTRCANQPMRFAVVSLSAIMSASPAPQPQVTARPRWPLGVEQSRLRRTPSPSHPAPPDRGWTDARRFADDWYKASAIVSPFGCGRTASGFFRDCALSATSGRREEQSAPQARACRHRARDVVAAHAVAERMVAIEDQG